jgi:zinc protease
MNQTEPLPSWLKSPSADKAAPEMPMKLNKTVIHCAILAVFILCSCARPDAKLQLNNPAAIPPPPLHYSIPQPERVVLDNGMVLYLLEDHEIPLIEVTALIRTGSVYDPPGRAGLASLTGDLMRTGGAGSLTPQAVDEKLEFMDAAIALSIESESGSASLSVLKKDFDAAFDIYAQILTAPVFAPDRLAIAREQKTAALRQLADNPQSLAFRKFKKLLYKDNPRGNLPTIESISSIKRDDVTAFHKIYFHPDRIILGVSGDFSSREMIAAVKKRFTAWKPSREQLPAIPKPLDCTVQSQYYLKKNIPQATIILGHLAPSKNSPDYYAFEVLDYILGGGGFSSRLTSEIRSNRGLAYSVGSFYRPDVDYGVFGAYCMTKSSTTHKALALMIDIMSRMKDTATQSELAQASESLISSFVFSYSSSAQIIKQRIQIEYDHLPQDFTEKFPSHIKAVTLQDLQRVAGQYLHPSRSIVLVVGDDRKFDMPLSSWGPVQEVFSDIQN